MKKFILDERERKWLSIFKLKGGSVIYEVDSVQEKLLNICILNAYLDQGNFNDSMKKVFRLREKL